MPGSIGWTESRGANCRPRLKRPIRLAFYPLHHDFSNSTIVLLTLNLKCGIIQLLNFSG